MGKRYQTYVLITATWILLHSIQLRKTTCILCERGHCELQTHTLVDFAFWLCNLFRHCVFIIRILCVLILVDRRTYLVLLEKHPQAIRYQLNIFRLLRLVVTGTRQTARLCTKSDKALPFGVVETECANSFSVTPSICMLLHYFTWLKNRLNVSNYNSMMILEFSNLVLEYGMYEHVNNVYFILNVWT